MSLDSDRGTMNRSVLGGREFRLRLEMSDELRKASFYISPR